MQENTIGDKIREYRQKLGLTQDYLASELHVSPQAISKWENGQTMPDINLLLPLSHLLGIGVNELLGGDRRAELERAWQRALPFGDELALLAADDALKEFPDDEEFLFRRAQAEYDLGIAYKNVKFMAINYFAWAQEHFEYLHTNFPDNDKYTIYLSEVYFARGMRDKALDLIYSAKSSSRQRSLIAQYLGGEEEIRFKQTKLEDQMKDLYNTLVDINTRESLGAAHSLLDVMMGDEKGRRSKYLWSLYLSDAELCLDEGDLDGYAEKFAKAYEAMKAYAVPGPSVSYTDPLFDRLTDNRNRSLDKLHFFDRFLSSKKLGHHASIDVRRKIADECVTCFRLWKHEWIDFYQFCRRHFCCVGPGNFATQYNKDPNDDGDLKKLLEQYGAHRFHECHIARGRKLVEDLLCGGQMHGFAAHAIGNRIVAFCNAWDKTSYSYLPLPEKYCSVPEGEKVMFFAEILVEDNLHDCGIDERLIKIALDYAENNDYTKAEVYLYDNDSAKFDRDLALYQKFGFRIAYNLTEDGKRKYILQKDLNLSAESRFKLFEREVIEMIAKENPEFADKIMAQYNKARVINREFTGHGFFTNFEVTDPADSLGEGYDNQLGNLTVEFPGVKYGACFVLFIKNGFIEMLEGCVYGNDPWPDRITEYKLVPSMNVMIKNVIDKHDPMGLLAMGCPDDEYIPEVKRLAPQIKKDMTEQELSALIHDVFVEMFSEPIAKDLCDKMAQEILSEN